MELSHYKNANNKLLGLREKLLKVRVEGEPKLIGHQVIRDVAQLYNHPTNHSCNPPHNLANLNNNMI